MAKVLVAERHESARADIRSALERAGHEVCAECEDAASAVLAVHRTRPAVCLIDLDLPGGGLSAVRAIAARRRPPRIIVLAPRVRNHDFFAALRAGASGFLVKDVDPHAIPSEVEGLLADGAALAPGLTARLIEEFRAVDMRQPAGPRAGPPSEIASAPTSQVVRR